MSSPRNPIDTTTTRRTSLRLAGGGALASLGLAAFGGRALAQEASPVPDSGPQAGHYFVARTRTVKPDSSMEEMNAAISEGLAPLLQAIPGFVEYYVVQNDETRERTGVSVFTDKAGADESTRVVGDYLADFADYYEDVEPTIQEGTIVFSASCPADRRDARQGMTLLRQASRGNHEHAFEPGSLRDEGRGWNVHHSLTVAHRPLDGKHQNDQVQQQRLP